MSQQKLSLEELLGLIELESFRKIIDPEAFLNDALNKGIPKVIRDVRGAIRLAVEREGDGFLVTKYPTEQSRNSINEIY